MRSSHPFQAPIARVRRWRLLLCLLGAAFAPALTVASETAPRRLVFEVRVSLSVQAAAALHRSGEGIMVSAAYAGDPRPRTRKYANAIGQISLGAEEIEMPGKAGSVTFSGSHIHQNRIAWIKGPILLNVNVFSARRRGPDNILACDFFDGKLEDAVTRPVLLHCSLIEEKTETMHKS